MKLAATLLLLIVALSALGYIFWYKPKFNNNKNSKALSFKVNSAHTITLKRLRAKAIIVKEYAKANNYNTNYCFMLDMSIASVEKRFFVYNLTSDSIELAGLVAHDSGSNRLSTQIEFSNSAYSLCTSLGKYKIGNVYAGKFGLAFKLYGLDATNSNACSCFIVLHAHPFVPNQETAPLPFARVRVAPP